MPSVQVLPQGKQSFEDGVGAPLAGGKLYTYASGTLTPLATYSDAGGTTPNANPIILDTRGEATIYWAQGTAYRVILQDSLGNVIWPAIDGLFGATTTLAGVLAAGLRFRDLPDAFASFTGRALQVVRVNAGESGLETAAITLGATAFTGLTDAFASYAGKENQPVVVNAGASGLTTDGVILGDASYKMSASQPMSAGVTATIAFNSQTYDGLSRGTFSTSTYTYTAGAAGARILVTTQIMCPIANGQDIQLFIEKNAATVVAQCRVPNEITSGTGNYYASLSRLLSLAASETVRVRAQISAAQTVDSGLSSSYFEIVEIA